MKRIHDLKTRRGGIQGVSQDASVEEAIHKFLDAERIAPVARLGGTEYVTFGEIRRLPRPR